MCTLLVVFNATSVSAQLPFGPDAFFSPDLPQAIQDCVDAGTCTSPQPLVGTGAEVFEPTPLFRHYRYVDFSSGTGTQMELLQYAIGGDSGSTTVNLDTGNAVLNRPYSGAAWLAMQSEYDLSNNAHSMTLYFEQVSNDAFNFFSETPNAAEQTVDISLTTEGLLAGTGELFFDVDGPSDQDRASLNFQKTH